MLDKLESPNGELERNVDRAWILTVLVGTMIIIMVSFKTLPFNVPNIGICSFPLVRDQKHEQFYIS